MARVPEIIAAPVVRRADGKILATILSLHGGDERTGYTHAKAIDPGGVEYFIFYNALQASRYETLDDLQIGSLVWGTPIEHPRGWRLIEVEIKER